VFSIFDNALERIRGFKFSASFGRNSSRSVNAKTSAGEGGHGMAEQRTAGRFERVESCGSHIRGHEFHRAGLCRPADRQVYEIPHARWSPDGSAVTFQQLPIYDSPVIIAEKKALPLEATAGQ
jgi:hypothetical protein